VINVGEHDSLEFAHRGPFAVPVAVFALTKLLYTLGDKYVGHA
jgi:hypothetical protein